jgi:hypothetical protein
MAHRESALLLHGLSQADQRWILSQLDPANARVLRTHLRELRDLGIPADPALAPSGAPTRAPQGSGADAARLERASAASLQLALADEPAWLVAQLLALRAWPWRKAFLDGSSPERRAAIEAAGTSPLPPRAEAALLAAVGRSLVAQLAPPAAAGPAQAIVGAARRTLGRWF